MGWKLVLVLYLHSACAANLGASSASLDVVLERMKHTDIVLPGTPIVNIERGVGSLGLCNTEDDDSTGFCVPAGTCASSHHSNSRQVVGQCASRDMDDNPHDCCKYCMTCGMTSNEIVTYFTNPSYPREEDHDLACNSKIIVRPGVCQVRFDFLKFDLPTPNQRTGYCEAMNSMKVLAPLRPHGVLGGKKNNGFCGDNSGQHFYVPVHYKDQIDILSTISEKHHRSNDKKNGLWNIKITQIECNSERSFFSQLEAPVGCLQYFTEPFGTISSFNFDGTATFSPDQDYAICIKSVGSGHTGKFCKMNLRANYFGMPVGGGDIKYCEAGSELVNPKKDRECCNEPHSSYVGVVGCQPHPHKQEVTATRRYWCGKELGSTGEIEVDVQSYIIKVWSGYFTSDDLEKLSYNPIGFSIDYKLTSGIC